MKVLIVDDEEVYRRQLEIALAPAGHEIRTASSGREAIDIGMRYRPDVLVADWMLKNHIHGLHVARVLRAVRPDVATILVTGFASADLRAEAGKSRVFDFVEKPFDVEQIRSAVQAAGAGVPTRNGGAVVAVLEVDRAGTITYANAHAREMLGETRAGGEAASLTDLFSPDAIPDLDAAVEDWVVVFPKAAESVTWHIRAQRASDLRLVVLRHPDDPQYLDLSLLEMLLGFKDPVHARWPFEERVLVLDDEVLNRTFSISLLESVGASGHAVESPNEGIRLLEHDEGLKFVVMDYNIPNTKPAETVKRIRQARPDAVIVGTSGAYHRDDFAALGVKHFLQKPWRIDDLINTLTGRIGSCIDCGLPIPLRHARTDVGETATGWICQGCGARYHAVFDDEAPTETRRNAQPAGSA